MYLGLCFLILSNFFIRWFFYFSFLHKTVLLLSREITEFHYFSLSIIFTSEWDSALNAAERDKGASIAGAVDFGVAGAILYLLTTFWYVCWLLPWQMVYFCQPCVFQVNSSLCFRLQFFFVFPQGFIAEVPDEELRTRQISFSISVWNQWPFRHKTFSFRHKTF